MIKTIRARLQQRYRTTKYPQGPAPELPPRFRGLPALAPAACAKGCEACVEACPTGAIAVKDRVTLDLGRCLFCGECETACRAGTITFSHDHRLATSRRDDLVLTGGELRRAEAMSHDLRRLLGRSLKLRVVSAGGCNACEADVNVLSTVGWDLGRFGIQVVASPRHADALLVIGPVTGNMRLALQKTWEAVPTPKLVIAVGACAISGGPYIGHPEQHDGAASTVPVDLFIPGCPPHPLTILDGLLRLVGKGRD
jgi:Ni,Fe-hydrogenase III small subunit